MKKNFITIILMLASRLLFAQDDVFKASWVFSPVKVNGNAEEWSQPLRYYDADTKLFFAFANDDKDLYLCFQTADNMNQMKIMHAGMEISLNIKGAHKATINFPLEQTAETSLPQNENDPQQKKETIQPGDDNNVQQKFNRANAKSSFLAQNAKMEVKGFVTKDGMIPINDSSGINAAIGWDQANKFTYEISIPLKELFGANYTPADISKNISLGVKINAMKGISHSGSNTGNNNFSGKEGTGRMGGGGGMHHNRNANNNAETENTEGIKEDKTDMSKKTEFKQKFVLAQKDTTKHP